MISLSITSHPGHLARIDSRKLQPGARHYNPSVCNHDGRTLLAYRYQDAAGLSRIGLAVLGKKWQVTSDRAVAIDAAPTAHLEDPRLCVIDGNLLLLVAQIDYVRAGEGWVDGFHLRAFRLGGDYQPDLEIPLLHGRNRKGRTEKNWMPFQLPEGGLGFVHSLAPEMRVIEHASGREHRTPGLRGCPWGTVSGRTPAVRIDDGRFLALIGGHVPDARRRSRYWVGAITFAAAAPHALLGVSAKPLLNPFDPDWNPACLFPAGLVMDEDGTQLLVSLGVNDSFCDLLRLDLDAVLAGLVPLAEWVSAPAVAAPGEQPAEGLVRVKVLCRQPIDEPGGPFGKGDEFFTTPSRAAALGPAKVQILLP